MVESGLGRSSRDGFAGDGGEGRAVGQGEGHALVHEGWKLVENIAEKKSGFGGVCRSRGEVSASQSTESGKNETHHCSTSRACFHWCYQDPRQYRLSKRLR